MATEKSNTKSDRRRCWDARDAFFKCRDDGKEEACEELKKKFVLLCPKVWVMEEFHELSANLQEKRTKSELKRQHGGIKEEEILKILRSCRETVDKVVAKCCGNERIEQSEYKGVRDLIGAAHFFSSAFHPPTKSVLEECYTLGDTLVVALASPKVSVESQILFSTALIQIAISGPCVLLKSKDGKDFCQHCKSQNGERIAENMISTVRCKTQHKYNLKLESFQWCKSLLSMLIGSDFWTIPTEKADGFELSLCYAFIMSSSRLRNLGAPISLQLLSSADVYGVIFNECSKYSKLTTLAFKTLASWLEKVSEFGLPLSKEVTQRVFTIVTASWEIALSGVRKDNARAFTALLSIDSESASPCLPSSADLLNAVVRQQLWSDVSKFYIVTELVARLGATKVMENYAEDMKKGLMESFHNNQLAAGGAHLYEALLKQLKLKDWAQYFLEPVLDLVHEVDGSEARYLRAIQKDKVPLSVSIEKVRTIQLNILNYWLRITANIFPEALTILREATFDRLSSSEFQTDDDDDHLSFLTAGVLHSNRKNGVWNPLTHSHFRKMAEYRDQVTSETYFKTLCASCKISDKIHQSEFDLILEFLKMHVNTDSPRMRQEIIKSINAFFYRFHVSLTNQVRANPSEDVSQASKTFLSQLLAFLSENLADEGFPGKKISYQRRITSLLIYLELLRSLDGTKNVRQRKDFVSPCAEMIRTWHASSQQQNMLASCMDDPTDTVQSAAFSILRERINQVHSEPNPWLDPGLEKCQSPVSHVAQSGLLYVLLGTWSLYCHFGNELLIDKKLEKDYPGYKESFSAAEAVNAPVTLLVFNIGLKILEHFKEKPMELTKSKSLHGIIDTMTALALKSQGPEFGKLHLLFQEKLLDFVEEIANFSVGMFMNSSENKDCAPSFAEMGIAIRNAAKYSTSQRDQLENDELNDSSINTSADERLLVKHLWLNLKACCQFAANVDGPEEMIKKCLNVIILVLRRCRHKGAIEAAGESLQSLISRISESTLNQKTRDLPVAALKNFLEDLAAGKTANETSITRRSAGLAIFVHHIVIGDTDPEKPLLKVAMPHLLASLNSSISDTNVNEKDLPQAQTLHILRTLVGDASLRVAITPYVNSVAESALVHLTSPIWSVRNGALQLFGALVPILVGQELPLAQFHFHHKGLFESLTLFVETAASDNSLQRHNDSVPAVVLLSRLTAPPKLLASQELLLTVERLKLIFFMLLGSHIMTVRRLAAIGLARMSCIEQPSLTVQAIRKWLEGNISQNAIHGSLLAVNCLWERCHPKQVSNFYDEIVELIAILPSQRCETVSNLLVDINNKMSDANDHHIENLLPHLKISSQTIPQDDAENTAKYFRSISLHIDIDYTRTALENAVQKMIKEPSLAEGLLPPLVSFVLNHPTAPNDILIDALTAIQQTINITIQNGATKCIADTMVLQLHQLSKQWTNNSVRAATVPVLLGLIHLVSPIGFQGELESIVSEMTLSCSFIGDQDHQNQLRFAETLLLLYPILSNFSYPSLSRNFIDVSLWFLQSEDTDIRDQVAEMVAPGRLSHTECLLKLLDPKFIQVLCKSVLTTALSLCDRLLFSDDELLQAVADIFQGCNANVWLRENPYVEDWYLAETAYKRLDVFLDEETFTYNELEAVSNALRLDEILPFVNKCKTCLNLGIKDDSADNVAAVIQSSSLVKNHCKMAYRTKIQDKCRQLQQRKVPAIYECFCE